MLASAPSSESQPLSTLLEAATCDIAPPESTNHPASLATAIETSSTPSTTSSLPQAEVQRTSDGATATPTSNAASTTTIATGRLKGFATHARCLQAAATTAAESASRAITAKASVMAQALAAAAVTKTQGARAAAGRTLRRPSRKQVTWAVAALALAAIALVTMPLFLALGDRSSVSAICAAAPPSIFKPDVGSSFSPVTAGFPGTTSSTLNPSTAFEVGTQRFWNMTNFSPPTSSALP